MHVLGDNQISPARGSCGEQSEPQGILMPFCFPLRAFALEASRFGCASRSDFFVHVPLDTFFLFPYMYLLHWCKLFCKLVELFILFLLGIIPKNDVSCETENQLT